MPVSPAKAPLTRREGLTLPPGPADLPFIGTPDLFRATANLLAYAEDLWKTYGDVTRFGMLGRHLTLVTHPDAIMRVLLTERAQFVKGSSYDITRRVMGDSMLTLEGDAWRTRRNLAQPAFHRASLERLCAIMVSAGARFFDALSGRGQGGQLIDAHGLMTHLTLEVVVDALFGRDIIDVAAEVPFEALGRTLELVSNAFNGVPLPRWLPTPGNFKFARTMRVLDETIYKIIEAGRRRASDDGTLLSMLLAARDEDGHALSDRALRDDVFTLFLAGHETTALTLTWLFVLLDGRDDVLRQLEDEVDGVLGGRDPTFADVPKLVYVRQVVEETLRLRPPAPMVARDALVETTFGSYVVPAGEVVVPFFWGTHRHPDFWEHPYRFDPNRFAPDRARGRNNWAYVPFSSGPRICIGNTFALMESAVLIAQLLNRFDVKVLSTADVKPIAVGTVRPSKPVRVMLSPRRRPMRNTRTNNQSDVREEKAARN